MTVDVFVPDKSKSQLLGGVACINRPADGPAILENLDIGVEAFHAFFLRLLFCWGRAAIAEEFCPLSRCAVGLEVRRAQARNVVAAYCGV